MEYYHDLVAQKSWQELQDLRKTVDFVLIGGWAVYFYTQALKSKDIDIIVGFEELPILQKNYPLYKNDRLKKYEAVKDAVQIDIYLPHYSSIGLPVEDLMSRGLNVEGFRLLDSNYLAVLKIYTLAQRGRSPKGRKDLLDLLSLSTAGKLDLLKVGEIVRKYQLHKEAQRWLEFLAEQDKIPELNLNPHQYSRIKREVVSQLKL